MKLAGKLQFGWFAVALLIAPLALSAQAVPAGVEQANIRAFGLLSYVNPDYGGAKKNAGGTVGADFTFGGAHLLRPGIEFRVLGSGGRVSNQYSYSGGPRVELHYGHFRPYAHFLLGYGAIKFQNPAIFNGVPYTQNNSAVYSFGGGTDYELSRSWAIRADVTSQHWRITHTEPAFHPMAISIGVSYRLHFHNKYGPE